MSWSQISGGGRSVQAWEQRCEVFSVIHETEAGQTYSRKTLLSE